MPGHADHTCFEADQVQKFFDNHLLLGYVQNTFVDQDIFDGSPVKSLNDLIFYEQLNFTDHIRKEITLNYNEV